MTGRLKLSHRFTLVFSLVLFSFVGILLVAVESYLRETWIHQSELRIRSVGSSLASVARPHLLNYNYIQLQQMADAVLKEHDVVYAVILDKENKVAGFSNDRERQGLALEDEGTAFAVNTDRAVTRQVAWQPKTGERQQVLEAVIPVNVDSQRWGTVRVGLSLENVMKQLWATRLSLLALTIAGFIGSVLASSFLARRIVRPLGRLVDATLRLERGEWTGGLIVETNDEIGDLAQRFSTMAESLDRRKRALVAAKEELTALNATLEDKVEQRTAELSASREKYRLLVEGSPDAFVLLDGRRFAFVNPAFVQIFEYSLSDTMQAEFGWDKVIHGNFHREARELIASAETTLNSFRTEWLGMTRSGRLVDLEVRGRGVRYLGAPAVELVLSDVTEKRRLLRQVVQNERLRAMGEMTAMVAHHFNNLLAIINGRAQLLSRKIEDERLRASLEIIQNSVVKAGEMVRHLQDYYGEHVDLRFVEIDVNTLLEDVAGYQERLWRTTRSREAPPISVRLDLQDIPTVRGADPLLQDAFRRILVNAAESMAEGGEIVVRTRLVGDAVDVEIIDQGVGMDPEVLSRAFDPFFTTKGPSTRGLGLSASLGVIQRHEGRIQIDSAPNSGTTVRVSLPVESRIAKIVPLESPRARSQAKAASGDV